MAAIAIADWQPPALKLPRLPQPVPYQGSKRLLAPRILAIVAGREFRRLYEPFAGSAAVTIAAAYLARSGRIGFDAFVLGDSLAPLVDLWRAIVDEPERLARCYEEIWEAQLPDPAGHYAAIRDEFNRRPRGETLLYLLARCVKNAPRFNRGGEFNQSPDHRRLGMTPAKMTRQIAGASLLLSGAATVRCEPFEDALASASPDDLIYMDPPYEGTSVGVDRRYHAGMERERLIASLHDLKRRRIPYLLSYDGESGGHTYGPPLPESIGAVRLALRAGRSSQATLLGRNAETVESLYVSEDLYSLA